MSVLTIQGNSRALAATTTAANVAFPRCSTSTFQLTNAGSTGAYVYVGITNTPVTTFTHPVAGGASAQGVILAPNSSITLSGNFKANIDANVYVYAVTAVGTATLFATPVIGY